MDFKELDKYIKAIENVPHMIDAALEMCGQDSYDNYICRIRNFSEAYEELSKLDAEQILNEALFNTEGEPELIKKLLRLWRVKLYPNKYDGYVFDINLKWGHLDKTYRKKLSVQGVLSEVETNNYLSCLFRLSEMAEAKSHRLLDVVNRLKAMAGIDTPDQKRTIDEEALKTYFNKSFFGAGMGSNYWLSYVISLRKNWCDKDFGRIAIMTYESRYMLSIKKPQTFKSFYQEFCRLVGCQFHKDYKPYNLDITKDISIEFSYLLR